MAVSSPGQRRKLSPAPWHGLFLSMLPTIRRHAEGAFEHLRHDDFDDALSEVVAHALVVVVALVELGKPDLAFPRSWPAMASTRPARADVSATVPLTAIVCP